MCQCFYWKVFKETTSDGQVNKIPMNISAEITGNLETS